jgi:hypothetical protein
MGLSAFKQVFQSAVREGFRGAHGRSEEQGHLAARWFSIVRGELIVQAIASEPKPSQKCVAMAMFQIADFQSSNQQAYLPLIFAYGSNVNLATVVRR